MVKISKLKATKIAKKLGEKYLNHEFIGRGNHNEVYKLITNKKDYVIRIQNNEQFKNLKREYKLLKKCKHLGPIPYIYDNSKKILNKTYLVEEYIKGGHPKIKIVNKELIKKAANWYKKLHRIKKSIIKKDCKDCKYSIYNFFDKLKSRYQKSKHTLPKYLLKKFDFLILKIEENSKKYDKIFSRRKTASLIHADPSPGNILLYNDQIKFIDWEFARFDIKEWDLVYFIYSYYFDQGNKEFFLKSYGYKITPESRLRIEMPLLLHYLDRAVWRIERLKLVKKGRADKKQIGSNKSYIVKGLKNDIKNIEVQLKFLKNKCNSKTCNP